MILLIEDQFTLTIDGRDHFLNKKEDIKYNIFDSNGEKDELTPVIFFGCRQTLPFYKMTGGGF